MTPGRLESINVSRGGVPKRTIAEARITATGVDGDRQAHLQFHGGPDRAVVLFSLDVIRALQAEGHPIDVGTTGENLTVSGLKWDALAPGDELQIGGARLHLTQYAGPCETIRRSFLDDNFTRISEKRFPGWSRMCARVIAGGLVRIGDSVEKL